MTWRKTLAAVTIFAVLLGPALVDPVLMLGPMRKLAMLVVAGWFGLLFLSFLQDRTMKSWAQCYEIMAENPIALAIYNGARIIAVAIACGMALCVPLMIAKPAHAGMFPSTYDKPIKAACEEFLPDTPWLLCKSQWFAESRLDPKAVSPAGAAGLVQLMTGTAEDIRKELGYSALDRHSVEPSLRAGSYYRAKLKRMWNAKRPWWDRHALSLAAYNAGAGNLLAAQDACGGATLYEQIISCLPSITGRHAAETIAYAPRIRRFWTMMEAGA